MLLAPVVLFTYKRLDTLKKTIESLQKNDLASESDLYIFSDAAKTEKDEEAINYVREYIYSIQGFKNLTIVNAEKNKGLAASIIEGVSSVLKSHDKVIVLEDDLNTSVNFLSYMNVSLNKYEDASMVFSISGYSFNLGTIHGNDYDSYFLNRGWSWGWATWKDRWIKVDWQVSDYAEFATDKNAKKAFSKGGSDLNSMLKKQMNGSLDSWAVRWFYHQYKIGGLTLYPVLSKVYNNGFDSFATHTSGSQSRYIPVFDLNGCSDWNFPESVIINNQFQKKFNSKMDIRSRIISKLETLLIKLFNRRQ